MVSFRVRTYITWNWSHKRVPIFLIMFASRRNRNRPTGLRKVHSDEEEGEEDEGSRGESPEVLARAAHCDVATHTGGWVGVSVIDSALYQR